MTSIVYYDLFGLLVSIILTFHRGGCTPVSFAFAYRLLFNFCGLGSQTGELPVEMQWMKLTWHLDFLQFVLASLAGWGLLGYGGYKLFGGKKEKKEKKEEVILFLLEL